MHQVGFAPEAEEQLVQIYNYIAAEASPEIAADYTEAIVRLCETLQTFPLRGTRRDDIRAGLRVFGFRRRVSIAFEVGNERVTILGVYYGGQNFEADIKQSDE
jgi:toxin ParE1/3/4